MDCRRSPHEQSRDPTRERARVLWIAPQWPLPANDGARVATASLLGALARDGWRIDLAAVIGESEEADPVAARTLLGLNRAVVVRRKSYASVHRKALSFAQALMTHPRRPVTLHAFAAPNVRRSLDELLGSGRYDTVVYDGLHPAAHASRGGSYQRPWGVRCVVFRAHNVEEDIWRRKAETNRNPLARAFLRYQAERVRVIESALVTAADAVATVSQEDLDRLRKASPAAKGVVVPIGYEFAEPLVQPSGDDLKLMFVGRLDWPPNRDGLSWFMRRVWPAAIERRPTLRLAVAGVGDSSWFLQFASMRGVRFLGCIDRVDSLYADADISIVPVFYGSGTRVKVIEAARFGRCSLSTALGVEGTGLVAGRSYCPAETEDDWIQALVAFERQSAAKVGLSAHAELRRRFDVSSAGRTFSTLLERAAVSTAEQLEQRIGEPGNPAA